MSTKPKITVLSKKDILSDNRFVEGNLIEHCKEGTVIMITSLDKDYVSGIIMKSKFALPGITTKFDNTYKPEYLQFHGTITIES